MGNELAWGTRYVAVDPTHFRVEYQINPFMDVAVQPDPDLAARQWRAMVAAIEAAGGTVSVLEVPEAKRPALRIESGAPDGEASEADASDTETAGSDAPEPRAGTDAADAPAASDDTPTAQAADVGDDAEAPTGEPAAGERPARTKGARAKVVPTADEEEASEPTDASTTQDVPAQKPRAARKPKAPKPETEK